MSDLVAIVGNSGDGKSTSVHNIPELGIKGLNPAETLIINVSNKPLPVRGWKKLYTQFKGASGNYLTESDSKTIVQAIQFVNKNRPDIKNIVIDDFQFVAGFEFMQKALETGFSKFAQMAKHLFDVTEAARNSREDIKVFMLTHSEENQKDFETIRKIKTFGKMFDQNITLEGLFTVVLYCHTEWDDKTQKGSYYFITNKTAEYPAKSPVGMFDNIQIPNDLGYVANAIDKYNYGE